jgi:hypothetical protein
MFSVLRMVYSCNTIYYAEPGDRIVEKIPCRPRVLARQVLRILPITGYEQGSGMAEMEITEKGWSGLDMESFYNTKKRNPDA